MEVKSMPSDKLCQCPSCFDYGLDRDCLCFRKMYNDEICCECEDLNRSGPHEAAQLALAVLHSGWKLSVLERRILTARTEDWDLEDIARCLGISWKRALKIEGPLLAKIEAHPEGLPKSARRIIEQKAWRKTVEMGGSIEVEVEGNVIRLAAALN
jgi:hypothetical protein